MSAVLLSPGTLFASDYEVVKPLRTGGMGTVYVALQKSTGKQRALKLMLPQLVADVDLRRRFEQEARIASLIESDHVVEVVGAGVDETTGAPWLAMELLLGTDLERVVQESGPVPLDETWRIMKQICHALSAAHAAGIIHRDLKPENVFLSDPKSSNEERFVKVLDFGIAKIAVEAATKQTAALGSPIWMAPEQTERGAVTPAADVWALGLIAFFLLTGRRFWLAADSADGTVQQVMREVLFGTIPSASARARQYGVGHLLPPWFDGWFGRCLVRDPSVRLPNAAKAFSLFDRSFGTASSVPRASPSSASGLSDASASQPGLVRGASVGTIPVRSAAASAATMPTAPVGPSSPDSFQALGARTHDFSTRAIDSTPSTWSVRPGFLVGILAAAGIGYGAYHYIEKLPDPPQFSSSWSEHKELPHLRGTLLTLPPQLRETHGAVWFDRNRARCNPVEVELVLQGDPPPGGKDGAGFSAACYVLAGKLEKARKALDALPADERQFGSWAVFEVVHPIADGGDDASAGPAMRLVLDYWPSNYMALYHAGMSEYLMADPDHAKDHLTRFLAAYHQNDGFTQTAKTVLGELERAPSAAPDCATPLTVDPEGREIFRKGCAKL